MSNKNIESYIKTRIQIDENTQCWNWIGTIGTDGYGKAKHKGKTVRAHRLSYSFFVGEIPAGLFVCHSCDNPKCVNPMHLWVGTHKDNELDKDRKKRRSPNPSISHPHLMPRGSAHFFAKLSEEQVLSILSSTQSTKDLSKIHDVSVSTIQRILAGKSWTHMPGAKERQKPREVNSTAKLTKENVLAILASSESIKDLAQKYGVSCSAIYRIRKGETWINLSNGEKNKYRDAAGAKVESLDSVFQ